MTPDPRGICALLIEDNPGDARLIRETLKDAGASASVQVVHADRLATGLDILAGQDVDVVLLDLSLPDSTGLDTFTRVHTTVPGMAVVVLSGLNDESVAVRAVQEGAQDYLVKGEVDGPTLVRSMRYAVERQKLESARRELEHQRDEFFSSVSHDLRTPVAAIKAAIGVVLQHEPDNMPAPLHRLLGNVDQAADELATLIEDLLEIARLQSHRVELWRSEVDMRDVVSRAVRAVEPLFQSRQQRVDVTLPTEPVPVAVDVERIGRVLRNVLGNAQKYAPAGSTVTVVVEPTADGTVCVVVADQGPGIPAADQERIFERFYRVPSAGGTGPAGSGLGLAIARGLAELHGGRLWVESTPGQGSTFRLTLPLPAGDNDSDVN
jgi:signal transduction histidine kinase